MEEVAKDSAAEAVQWKLPTFAFTFSRDACVVKSCPTVPRKLKCLNLLTNADKINGF